jgi:hypothetical protein
VPARTGRGPRQQRCRQQPEGHAQRGHARSQEPMGGSNAWGALATPGFRFFAREGRLRSRVEILLRFVMLPWYILVY